MHEEEERLAEIHRSALGAGLAAIAIAIVVLIGEPASATEFQAFGSRGDAKYHDVCKAGSYLVGLRVRSGSWMDQLAIICRPFKSDGSFGGPEYGDPRGGPGGGPGERTCPQGRVIKTMYFFLTEGSRQVSGIVFDCLAPPTKISFWDKAGELAFGNLDRKNDDGVKRPDQNCPEGEAATGLHGNYGKHVNAIGLICGPLRPAVMVVLPETPAAPGKPHDPLFEPVHKLRVKPLPAEGAAPAGGGAAQGTSATAVNDTDVYPDNTGESDAFCTMNTGDKGTLIEKKADDDRWLHISGISGECGGKTGWVWQGDDKEDVRLQ